MSGGGYGWVFFCGVFFLILDMFWMYIIFGWLDEEHVLRKCLQYIFSPGETCGSRNGRVGKFNFRKHWKSSPKWIPWMKITMVVKSECPSLNITLLWKKGTL